jgi:RNA recognition motif-containing protein
MIDAIILLASNTCWLAKYSRITFQLYRFHMTIYIGNLSYQATEEDLKSVFEDYGSVKRVVLPTDRETGRMRGFAFVEMSDDASEDNAITNLDGAEWMGRSLKVNKARPRDDNGGGGSRGGARSGDRSSSY